MEVTTFDEASILAQLDDCAIRFEFPMLDNGYIYPADARLHAYADRARWALVVEDIGYHQRTGDHESIVTTLSCFGNCLTAPNKNLAFEYLNLTSDAPGEKTFESEDDWYLQYPTGRVCVRGQLVTYDCTNESLSGKGIPIVDSRPSGNELLRSLVLQHRDLLFANESELRRQVPHDLPCLLTLSEWYHPDLAGEELPSACESFRQIAKVMCNLDPTTYKIAVPPNTHWSNWPEGGSC